MKKPNKKDYELTKRKGDSSCNECDVSGYCYSIGFNNYALDGECLEKNQIWKKKSKAASPIVEKVEVGKQPIVLSDEDWKNVCEEYTDKTGVNSIILSDDHFKIEWTLDNVPNLKHFVEYILNNYKP